MLQVILEPMLTQVPDTAAIDFDQASHLDGLIAG